MTRYLLDKTIYSIYRLTIKEQDKYQLGMIHERRGRELRGKKTAKKMTPMVYTKEDEHYKTSASSYWQNNSD